MTIGGLQKITLIDYPGKIAATVFLSGCNFRCPWCYSSELVLPEKIKNSPKISEEYFFDFLKEKEGLIEGIVICGGEPCINKDLESFARKIKDSGYFVKLDTNGSNPQMIKNLVEKKLIDYIAMDIKAPKNKYKSFSGKAKIEDIEKSVNFLKNNPVDFEFRTTVIPNFHKEEDIFEIAKWICSRRLSL